MVIVKTQEGHEGSAKYRTVDGDPPGTWATLPANENLV